MDEGKQMCHLFPLPPSLNDVGGGWRRLDPQVPEEHRDPDPPSSSSSSLPWVCRIPGVSELCRALEDVYDLLTPAADLDGDKFSPVETLRGAIWRGRDCDDINGDIRPGMVTEQSRNRHNFTVSFSGRRPRDDDRSLDSNCNGIWGVDAASGRPWEERLCGGSGARGVIYVGDSVTAHFHAPPVWFTPRRLVEGIWQNFTYVVANEGDWPDLGFATGFRDSQMPTLIGGGGDHTDSFYLRLRRRNLCNHRDYQNLARNGAQSNDTLDYMRSLSRSKEEDNPAVVFYSLIGNDVCNEFPDTEAHMTPADVFRNNTMTTLR